MREVVKDNTAKLCGSLDISQDEIKNTEITHFVAHIHICQQGI